ncbi:MAG: 3D domain-containing protein [Phycisphaerae bacterium]
MSRPGKALVYMFPLLVGSTILVLGHTALTQEAKLPAPAASVPAVADRPDAAEAVSPEPEPEPAPTPTPAAARSVPPPAPSGRARGETPAEARSRAADPPAPEAEVEANAKRRTVTVEMLVTGYCPCRKCCGSFSDGKTASGKRINYNGGKFIAADTSLLPFGTMVSIPGYNGGRPVPVEDRGGRIKGRRLDLFFFSHHQARQWGARRIEVTVYLDDED